MTAETWLAIAAPLVLVIGLVVAVSFGDAHARFVNLRQRRDRYQFEKAQARRKRQDLRDLSEYERKVGPLYDEDKS